MEQEYLLKQLNSQTEIDITKMPADIEADIDRVVEFNVRGAGYRIEWWVNICYLFCGELLIPFNDISFDGCWPNDFKLNMVFIYCDKRVAVLPLEQY